MKKFETLKKLVETVDAETLNAIVQNENVDCETLTAKEKLAVLIYDELNKALSNKKQTLVLDCNFENSKFHNKEDEDKNEYLVDYFALVSNDDVNTRLIQFYVRSNAESAYCNLYTSCKKATREQFEALEDTLHFTVKRDKKTQRAKTSYRNKVDYLEVAKVVKDVLAILANETK